MVEYEEGIFKQDLATVEGEIKLAESDLSRAEDRVDWAQRMYEKGYVSLATKNLGRTGASRRPSLPWSKPRARRRCWSEYTKDKTIKELKSEVEKAHSDELAKQATLDLENTKEKKLERQIAACKILAPSDGLVVYANDPDPGLLSSTPQIEEGAQVRERQKIFSLPDITKMQVNTKVHESQINKVKRGHEGEDPGRRLLERAARRHGDRTSAPLPDTANLFSSDIKVYTTKVRIDNAAARAPAGHERRGDDRGQQAR